MSAPKVHIISSSMLKIAHHAEFNLTPLDLELLFIEYQHQCILFLKPTPQQEAILLSKTKSSNLIQHLKESLQRTLQFFPSLAGHLVTTPADGGAATCFSVKNNLSGGALFIHASIDLSVADIVDSSSNAYVPEVVNSFFPLIGVQSYEGVYEPLLGVQVTELVDGLFMGWSHSHLVADGPSFMHFINSWAKISRGEIPIDRPISKLPMLNPDVITRDLLGASRIKIDNEHLIFDKNIAANPTCQLKERVFHFTRESVAKLKAKASKELLMLDSTINFGRISCLQAIIAHLWRSTISHRFSMNTTTTDNQETTFVIPMDMRQRLNPPLLGEYFGNAIFAAIVTLKVREMLENGLGWTAWQINKTVAATSNNLDHRAKEYYMSWIKNPKFVKHDELPRNHFVLINSPRFEFVGSDFGWGKPVAVRTGGGRGFDGRITVFGGVEKGSMDIQACLSLESLIALGEDPEFMVQSNSFPKHHGSFISSRF